MSRIARRCRAAGVGLLFGLVLVCNPAAAQEWTGKARIEGKVTGEKGEPVAGAVVKLRRGKGGGPEIKADRGGHWAYLGLTGGSWDVDVSAPGYETLRTTVRLSEIIRIPPMDIKLKAEAP
ncbi:MAG: carboxypeptidase-like regulatory domain-containing protein, partial [Thermoanaerobaculia bacterium]